MDLGRVDLRKFAVLAALFIAFISVSQVRFAQTRPQEFASSADVIEVLEAEDLIRCVQKETTVSRLATDVTYCRRYIDPATTVAMVFEDLAQKEQVLRSQSSRWLVVGRAWMVTASSEAEARRLQEVLSGYIRAPI